MIAIHSIPSNISKFILTNDTPKSPENITETIAPSQAQEPKKIQEDFQRLFDTLSTSEEGWKAKEILKKINFKGHQPLSDEKIKRLFELAGDFIKGLSEGQIEKENKAKEDIQREIGLNGSFALAAVGHVFGMSTRIGDKKDFGNILTHIFLDNLANEGAFQGTKLSDNPGECFKQMRKLLEDKIGLNFLIEDMGTALAPFSGDRRSSDELISHDEAKIIRQNLIENTKMPLSNAELAQNPKKFEKLWVNSFREMMTNAIAQSAFKCDVDYIVNQNFVPILQVFNDNMPGESKSFSEKANEKIKNFNKVCEEKGYPKHLIKDVSLDDIIVACTGYLDRLDGGDTLAAKSIARKIEKDYGLSGMFALGWILPFPFLNNQNQNAGEDKNLIGDMGFFFTPVFLDYMARQFPELNYEQVLQKWEKILQGMGYQDLPVYIKEMQNEVEKLKEMLPDIDKIRKVSYNKYENILMQVGSIFSTPMSVEQSRVTSSLAKNHRRLA